MNCWICGDIADTREHLIKASDLKHHFGNVTQSKPLYMHDKNICNRKLQSIRSKYLTSKTPICRKCNSERTQQHDRAWETLSEYIKNNWSHIYKSNRMFLTKAFPGASKKMGINVQLYFVKIFGCKVVESNVLIDTRSLAEPIMNGKAHPHIFLVFNKHTPVKGYKGATNTDITVLERKDKGIVLCATWFYHIGDFSVQLIYSPFTRESPALSKSWHPSDKSKVIKVVKCQSALKSYQLSASKSFHMV